MRLKMNFLRSQLCRLCNGICFGSTRFRTFSSNIPAFPDPPCMPINPKCHFVKDNCRQARNVLALKLPFDKYVVEMERQAKANDLESKCCVWRVAHKLPCGAPKRKKPKVKKPPFRSMWEPPCQPSEQIYCKDFLPRFDEMFYRPSNKCRCFQRTWLDCPPIRERMKKVCCLDGIEPPEVLRRVKERCPKITCMFDYSRMRHICNKYKPDPEGKCCKIEWPCCKMARCPPNCPSDKKPKICNRLRTPYPCFSDVKIWQRPRRPTECPPQPNSMCEAFALQRRREIYGLKQV